jgi:Sulfotransferase domain
MVDRLIWVGMFQDRFEEKARAIAVFNRHNEEVRRTVPADRLLLSVAQIRKVFQTVQ